jgi:hypothetical protein
MTFAAGRATFTSRVVESIGGKVPHTPRARRTRAPPVPRTSLSHHGRRGYLGARRGLRGSAGRDGLDMGAISRARRLEDLGTKDS